MGIGGFWAPRGPLDPRAKFGSFSGPGDWPMMFPRQKIWSKFFPERMLVFLSHGLLTTYSRKPGNYNGTIILEIDIMKISSPLNLKFTFFANVKTKNPLFFLLDSQYSQLSFTVSNSKSKETTKKFV